MFWLFIFFFFDLHIHFVPKKSLHIHWSCKKFIPKKTRQKVQYEILFYHKFHWKCNFPTSNPARVCRFVGWSVRLAVIISRGKLHFQAPVGAFIHHLRRHTALLMGAILTNERTDGWIFKNEKCLDLITLWFLAIWKQTIYCTLTIWVTTIC